MNFFLFKQKTADKMRISDWSSDVCSSDLSSGSSDAAVICALPLLRKPGSRANQVAAAAIASAGTNSHGRDFRENRSEEHTSELQSLMRISYAVFCLKKKI